MPLLVVVESIHYSPKDSERATKALLVADDLEAAVGHIDREFLYGYLSEDGLSDDGHYYPDEGFWEANPEKRAAAERHSLTVDEYGRVSGTAEAVSRWLRSTDWRGAEDAYYGVTHYDWGRQREITGEEAATLVRLGLATDIRRPAV